MVDITKHNFSNTPVMDQIILWIMLWRRSRGTQALICWSNLRIENENELNRKIREKMKVVIHPLGAKVFIYKRGLLHYQAIVTNYLG
jgi:hypothetical protein